MGSNQPIWPHAKVRSDHSGINAIHADTASFLPFGQRACEEDVAELEVVVSWEAAKRLVVELGLGVQFDTGIGKRTSIDDPAAALESRLQTQCEDVVAKVIDGKSFVYGMTPGCRYELWAVEHGTDVV